jgi:hypothetical protein
VSWRRIVALTIPVAVFLFALGFIVGLEVRRGPDWRLELEAYAVRQRLPSGSIAVRRVERARKPWAFSADMGRSVRDDAPYTSAPAREVVFLVRHSDALYQVGWLAYEGPEAPFGADVREDLETIGCDLRLDQAGAVSLSSRGSPARAAAEATRDLAVGWRLWCATQWNGVAP